MQADIVRFVPSNLKVVEAALKLAEIRAGEDVVYDLGTGDGRFVIASVQPPFYARKAVGFESKTFLAEVASDNVRKLNLQNKIEILNADFFNHNLSDADVVYMYLEELVEKVKPKLEHELRPMSRVISHNYEIRGWKPSKTVNVIAPKGDQGPFLLRPLYMYRMGEI